jgi:anti-sigma regulatory factor (Ser/Thr protein kinase)
LQPLLLVGPEGTGSARETYMPDAPIAIPERPVHGEPAGDDITVLSDRAHWISLRIACKLEAALRVAEFMREWLADLGPIEGEKLTLALRELLLNAVEHGGHLDPEKTVELSCIRTARGIFCYVRDPGEGFAPDSLDGSTVAVAPGQIFRHLDRRAEMGLRPGGLGLFLVKRIADELLYNAKGNEVILIKYL